MIKRSLAFFLSFVFVLMSFTFNVGAYQRPDIQTTDIYSVQDGSLRLFDAGDAYTVSIYLYVDDIELGIDPIQSSRLGDGQEFVFPDCSDDYVDILVSEGVVAEGSVFSHWERYEHDTKHQPGDKFTVDSEDALFYGVYLSPYKAVFSHELGEIELTMYDGITCVLPEAPESPEGKRFAGWKESVSGTIYSAGSEYTYNGGEVSFDAVYTSQVTVTFVCGDYSFECEWFVGDTVIMPECPAGGIPEGMVFSGWKVGNAVYKPGDEYVFGGRIRTYEAIFVDIPKIYLDSVNGNDANSGLASNEAVKTMDVAFDKAGDGGTVCVMGTYTFPNGGHFPSATSEMTIEGFDSSAKITNNQSQGTRFGSDLRFENIKVQPGQWGYFSTSGYTVTFGEGATSADNMHVGYTQGLCPSVLTCQTVVIESGTTISGNLNIGGFGTDGKTTIEGDLTVKVIDGTLETLRLSQDGYSSIHGNVYVGGNINVKVGSKGAINNIYNSSRPAIPKGSLNFIVEEGGVIKCDILSKLENFDPKEYYLINIPDGLEHGSVDFSSKAGNVYFECDDGYYAKLEYPDGEVGYVFTSGDHPIPANTHVSLIGFFNEPISCDTAEISIPAAIPDDDVWPVSVEPSDKLFINAVVMNSEGIQDEIVKYNEAYTYDITLEAIDVIRFSENFTFRINGKDAYSEDCPDGYVVENYTKTDNKISFSYTAEPTSNNVHEHTYGEWIVVEEPTLEKEGVKVRYCTVCDLDNTASIEKLLAQGECGDSLVYKIDNDYTLYITGTGAMTSYSNIEQYPWNSWGSKIKNIVIGKDVTKIVTPAFYNFSSLEAIVVDDNNNYYSTDENGALYNKNKTNFVKYPAGKTDTTFVLPNTLTSIDYFSFCWANNLKSVTIPENVNTIYANAFYGCQNLSSITIPESVKNIRSFAFAYCKALVNIEFLGAPIIDTQAFMYNTSLKSVNVNGSLGKYAFGGCTSLESISLDNGTIGQTCFIECPNLKYVSIGKNITKIDSLSFGDVNSIASFAVDNENANYSNDEYGALYNKDKTVLIRYPVASTPASYTVRYGVETIGSLAFYGSENLSSIVIPASVKTINSGAFEECANISEVVYKGPQDRWANVTIGSSNSALTEEILKFDVVASGDFGEGLSYYFSDGGVLVLYGTGDFPEWTDAAEIPWNAYADDIKCVHIESGITSLGSYTFDECSNISAFVVSAANTSYSSDASDVLFNADKTELIKYPCGSDALTYTVPAGVLTIGESAFAKSKIESITIDRTLEEVTDNAFSGCSNLSTIYYNGTQKMWDNTAIGDGNEALEHAELVFTTTFYTLTFNCDEHTFTVDCFKGDKFVAPALPTAVIEPEGKIFVAWNANGERYFAGNEYLCDGSDLVFTAEYIDRNPDLPDIHSVTISNFEAPYASGGSYAIKGVTIQNTTFDGYGVKSFEKTADKITAERTVNGVVQYLPNYPLNFFNYGALSDINRKPVSVRDASYVTVEYYYDTTGRDLTDENGQDLTGKKMVMRLINILNNGVMTNVGASVTSTSGIVANRWNKVVMPFTDIANLSQYQTFENDSKCQMRQFQLHPFGTETGIQMYKGDVFYVRSIEFTWFDPLNIPSSIRKTNFVLGDKTVHTVQTDCFEEVTMPYVVGLNETVEETEGNTYIYLKDHPEIGNVKFSGWKLENTDLTYNAGDSATFKTESDITMSAILLPSIGIPFTYGTKNTVVSAFAEDTITIPELPEDAVIPEEARFNGWKESVTGKIYEPGDSYTITDTTVSFEAEFFSPVTVTFNYGDKSFTEKWYVGDTVKVPALPIDAAIPEGKVFAGWDIGGKVYNAGSTFTFDGADTSAIAEFAIPFTVYYSADGIIDGIDNVYTSLSAADAAITAAGGVGTIIVEGDLTLNNATHVFTAIDVTIKGIDPSQTATFNATHFVAFQSAVNTKITFDDITIVRGSGTNDENFLNVVGATLVFGKNCTFVQGTRTTNNTKMNLYFGQSGSKNAGYTLVMNSPAVIITQLAPHGGWSGGNYTLNGDYKVVMNAGTVFYAFLVSRNGNGNGKASTVNGDVTYEINGGNITNLNVGSYKNDNLNGTGTVIINGGNISNFKYGNDGLYNSNKTVGTYDNLAVIYNVKNILNGGYSVPEIKKTANQNDVKNSVLVVNNAELITTVPSLDVADYNVQVRGGSAKPVFFDGNVYFEITPDDASKSVVWANGKMLEKVSNGLYYLGKGTSTVIFGPEGATPRTVTYLDGDEELGSNVYFPGDMFAVSIPEISKEGYVFEGFAYGGDIYNVGDVFVMPDEDVEFVINWYNNSLNAYYVSINGSDDNRGYKSSIPYKTVAKAYEAIGSNDGIIVIMGDYTAGGYIGNADSNKNFKFAENQHIIITGKDPYTGEVYNTKVTRPEKLRPAVQQGHIEISYITEIHVSNYNLCPFNVQGSAEFTLGTGYEFHSNNGANKCGVQVNTVGGTSPTLNIDGQTQFVTFLDWGSRTFSGDITINVGPNATFSSYGVVLGGDGGTVTATVQGKVYVTVNGNKSGKPIGLSGFKSTVSTVLNGVQIVLNETNMYVADKVSNAASYKNNGATYIVTTPVVPEGANVETTEFGKIKVTVPEGYSAVLAGATSGTYSEGEHIISLGVGNTEINILKTSGFVSVEIEGGETIEGLIAGSTYRLPSTAAAPYGKTFYGWKADGVFRFAGETIVLPAEDGAVLKLSPVYIDANSAIYYSSVAGNDAASGLSATEALASLAEVESRLAKFTDGKATMVIVDKLEAGELTLPKYNGVLTIKGGNIVYSTNLKFQGDVVFEDITIKCLRDWMFFSLNGHDLTFGKGYKKATDSKPIRIHAGKQSSDMTGDQKVTVLDGVVDALHIGPWYIPSSTTKSWTGNVEVLVDGGTLNTITHGDGYGTVTGGFYLNGSELITVKSGKLGTIQGGYLNAMSGNITVVDYVNSEFIIKNHPSSATDTRDPLPIYVFHMHDGINFESFEDGVLNLDKKALAVSDTDVTEYGDAIQIPDADEYDVVEGAVLESVGAQIRLTSPTALRFVANVSYASTASKADYGMLVYPTELLGEEELTHELVGEGKAKDVIAEKIYIDDITSFTYTAAITGIKDTVAGYTKKFTVVPYRKNADGTYTYAEAMNYSLYDIALAAAENGEDAEFVLKIISTVEQGSTVSLSALTSEGFDETTGTDVNFNISDGVASLYSSVTPSELEKGLTVIGAQIRTSTDEKPQAIRFTAKYTDSLSEQYKGCEFGFLVIPTKYVPSGESVTVGKRFLYKDRYYKVKKVPAVNIYEDADGYITYTVCITGTKALNYDRNFTVVPYIKNNEGKFLYSSPYTSSLVKVAEAITADATASTTDKAAAKKLLKEHDDAQWTGIYKP